MSSLKDHSIRYKNKLEIFNYIEGIYKSLRLNSISPIGKQFHSLITPTESAE